MPRLVTKPVPCVLVTQGKTGWSHRDKLQEHESHGLAMVARSVKPKEVKTNEKALAVLQSGPRCVPSAHGARQVFKS